MANTAGSVGGTGSPQGGQQGWDAAVNTQPIPGSNAGTLAAGTAGVAFTALNSDFAKIVTALVVRNIVDNLRSQPVFAAMGNYIRARNVPGTNKFVYTAFADLAPAQVLLEGVPPESEKMQFDTMELTGAQKGKLVAVTDLASLHSPFELYSVAAEKVAFNAVDTLEKDLAALVQGADNGIGIATVGATSVARVIEVVTGMKVAEVPTFEDGYYRAFISPADAAKIMSEAGELGWTDTMKYAGTTQLLNGEIGRFRGIRFIETTRVADSKTVVFGPEWAVWGDYQTIQAYRVAPGGDHADPLAQRGLVGWKGMWGVGLVKFDGTPAMGPASNPGAERWTLADLTP